MALESALSNKTYSASDQASLYQQSIASYFSLQDRLSPTCVVAPSSAQDVSKIVRLLSRGSCQFAVRSGGHGLLVGSSNIANGVTIDMSALNKVTLNMDQSLASVEPGARWIQVYEALDPLGWAIPGGRAGTVGVGGLTSGGGNSFFAARYGFVCDNVKNFEVVLGSGEIVQANNKTNPDLFTALRGSQNNLGIVTRFDIVAFEQGDLWGGEAIYANTTIPAQLEAFVKFTDKIEEDPYGSLIFVWDYTPATDSLKGRVKGGGLES